MIRVVFTFRVFPKCCFQRSATELQVAPLDKQRARNWWQQVAGIERSSVLPPADQNLNQLHDQPNATWTTPLQAAVALALAVAVVVDFLGSTRERCVNNSHRHRYRCRCRYKYRYRYRHRYRFSNLLALRVRDGAEDWSLPSTNHKLYKPTRLVSASVKWLCSPV